MEAVMTSSYQVTLYKSEEGYAVCVPGLPGCWSQGRTTEEAIENIKIAISEYLEADDDRPNGTPAAKPAGPGSPALSEEAEVREVRITD
jgi:predicted RNase H-like HicB family nuclease